MNRRNFYEPPGVCQHRIFKNNKKKGQRTKMTLVASTHHTQQYSMTTAINVYERFTFIIHIFSRSLVRSLDLWFSFYVSSCLPPWFSRYLPLLVSLFLPRPLPPHLLLSMTLYLYFCLVFFQSLSASLARCADPSLIHQPVLIGTFKVA